MRQRLAPLVFAMAVLSTLATSGAAAPRTVIGFGTKSCGSWTAWTEHGNHLARNAAEAWIFGYLSALNASVSDSLPDILLSADNVALLAWIDKHCREHPLDEFAKATDALGIELARRIGPR